MRGLRSKWEQATAFAAYVVAVPAGALVAGVIVHSVASAVGRPPMTMVGLIALAACATLLVPVRIPQSMWRIPRTWAKLGHTVYAALFGAILGLGFLTAIPSAAYYALVTWALAADSLNRVWPVFGAFGFGRVIVFSFLSLRSALSRVEPVESLDRLRPSLGLLALVEAAILAAITVTFLR